MGCLAISFAQWRTRRKLQAPKMNASIAQQAPPAPLDINWVRAHFPSLKLTVGGQAAAFLDAPAGTQVPQRVIDAFREYFETSNANTVGQFLTSRRTDEMIA